MRQLKNCKKGHFVKYDGSIYQVNCFSGNGRTGRVTLYRVGETDDNSRILTVSADEKVEYLGTKALDGNKVWITTRRRNNPFVGYYESVPNKLGLTVTELDYDEDFKSIGDSMTVDSGYEFLSATLRDKDGQEYKITIKAQGDVRVDYKGERFRYFTDMPDELQRIFLNGSSRYHPDVTIHNNNWWEVFMYKGDVLVDSFVFDSDPCDFENEKDITDYLVEACNDFFGKN